MEKGYQKLGNGLTDSLTSGNKRNERMRRLKLQRSIQNSEDRADSRLETRLP
jgi:hypothetical protein